VNVYAIPSRGGWVLIDGGVAGSWEILEESLAGAGIALGRLSHVLITHCHPDHTGLAETLRERTGAALWLHPADHSMLRQLKTSTIWHTSLERALRDSLVESELRVAAMGAWTRLVATFTPIAPDHPLEEGAVLETGLGPLVTLHTPGHTPGHCCFWAPEAGSLFSGDQLLEDATPHLAWTPGEDTLGGYLASLERLERLPARLVLPAHGVPFPSAARVVKRDLRRRRSRLNTIEKMISIEKLTAAAIVRRLWSYALNPQEFQMAFSEVMAFREHLARVARTSGQEAIVPG
jgi:glyoxylase-like metal-dependent hydrolase (beta-lactamase superfamily II)